MRSSNPEISVVIPVHNGYPYLREAIDSIIHQTYQNFRVLILENCSQDNTLSIINSYQDSRIVVAPSEEALSIEDNWARIITQDLSDYMTIMGHDDLLYPNFLQEIVNLIEIDPDASLYQTHFHLIDKNGKIIRNCTPMPFRENAEGFLRSRHSFARDTFGTGYVMKSADYKRIGGFPRFPKLICADDVTWYQLAQISHIVCSSHYLFGYRYHPQSMSYLIDMLTLYTAFKRYWEFLSQTVYFRSIANMDLARYYICKVLRGQYHRILVDLANSFDEQHITYYKEMKERLFAVAKHDALFSVYDPVSALLEYLLFIKPASLRRTIATGLYRFADATRELRKKR